MDLARELWILCVSFFVDQECADELFVIQKIGFQAAACIGISDLIMLNSKQRDEFGKNHDFMTYLKTFYPYMGGAGQGSTD